jgi:hypothetical protein
VRREDVGTDPEGFGEEGEAGHWKGDRSATVAQVEGGIGVAVG